MELSPLYQQRLEAATQQGINQGISQGLQQGINQGISQGLQQGKRLLIENFLQFRFGQVDEELSAIIESLLDVTTEEIPPLLTQFTREELIARFRN